MQNIPPLRHPSPGITIPYRYGSDGYRTLSRHYKVVADPDVLNLEGLRLDDGKLHVLYYAADAGGCGYYRAFTPCDVLRDSPTVAAYPSLLLSRPLVDWADVIVWQRTTGPRSVALAQQLAGKGGHIFDLDDDLFRIPKWSPAHNILSSPGFLDRLRTMLRLVPNISVTTVALYDALRQETDARAFIIPNAILPERFTPVPNTDDTIRVGWAGSATHLRDLHVVLPALHALRRARPNVQLVTFGWSGGTDAGNVFAGLDVEHHEIVPPHKFSAALSALRLDIGIAPLERDPFNEGKSPVKWEEYSALGIPTVASRVGPYAAAIDHGKTGLLASHHGDFYRHLLKLVDDRAARARIGDAARVAVLAEYGPDATRLRLESTLLAASRR